nr:Hypothetical protein [Pseudomonas aeruginosa]
MGAISGRFYFQCGMTACTGRVYISYGTKYPPYPSLTRKDSRIGAEIMPAADLDFTQGHVLCSI